MNGASAPPRGDVATLLGAVRNIGFPKAICLLKWSLAIQPQAGQGFPAP